MLAFYEHREKDKPVPESAWSFPLPNQSIHSPCRSDLELDPGNTWKNL